MQMSGYAKSAWQHCTQRGAHRLSTEAPTVRAGRFWSRLRLSVPPLGLPPEWGSKHRIMAESARMAGAVFAQGGSFNITDAQSEFVQLIAVQAVETRSALARSEIGKKTRPCLSDLSTDMRLRFRPVRAFKRHRHLVIGQVGHGILRFRKPRCCAAKMGHLVYLEKRININPTFNFIERWKIQ